MKLINGIDYYIESGKWVFTEQFLKTRPCCKNGCRHCPYGYKKPELPIKNDKIVEHATEKNIDVNFKV